jgi:hypothetical protein
MGGYGRKRVSLEGKDAPFEEDLVFFRKQIWGRRNGFLVAVEKVSHSRDIVRMARTRENARHGQIDAHQCGVGSR